MTKDDEKTQALFSHQEGELELEDQTLEKIKGAGWDKWIISIKKCFGCYKPPTPSPHRVFIPIHVHGYPSVEDGKVFRSQKK